MFKNMTKFSDLNLTFKKKEIIVKDAILAMVTIAAMGSVIYLIDSLVTRIIV